MAYKCYYGKSSTSAADFMSQLYGFLEAMGWTKTKGLELEDAAAFQTNHAYSQGDMVKPTTANGYIYICSTAGTSHAATEPTWGTTIKGETTSNTAKFRCYPVGRVYSSNAESGLEPISYIYLYPITNECRAFFIGAAGLAQWISATWLICGYTHGNGPSTSYSMLTGFATNPTYFWVYGNKDVVMIQALTGTTYNFSGFGFIEPIFTQRTVLTSAATAGSAVNLAVASSADVKVDQWLQIYGAAEEGRDKLVVSAIPDSTHITVTTLPRNYSSGSWIGINPHRPFLQNIGTVAFGQTLFGYMPMDVVGTGYLTAAGAQNEYYVFNQFGLNELKPDYRYQKYLLRPLYVYGGEGSGSPFHPVGYLPPAVILASSMTVASLDLFLVYDGYSYPVSGIATAGAATTLTDTGKSLTTNAWIGKILVITAGTGVGQTRNIISNTATEFTVNAWVTNPDNTSQYVVVDEAWRALGNGALGVALMKEII
jgi:hypothetical protein